MNQLARISAAQLPALITARGDRASWRFMEFFTAAIRNRQNRPSKRRPDEQRRNPASSPTA